MQLDRLDRTAQIRGEDRCDRIVAASPAEFCGQRSASLGQLPIQPAGGHARLIVGRQRVGLEDDRNGHLQVFSEWFWRSAVSFDVRHDPEIAASGKRLAG
jgi:hypothetical protein